MKCLWSDINRKKEAKYELEFNVQMGAMLGAPALKGGVISALKADCAPGETENGDGKTTDGKSKNQLKKERKAAAAAAAKANGATPTAKAKAKAKAAGGPAAPATAEETPEVAPAPPQPTVARDPKVKKEWTQDELNKLCHHFQFDACWYGDACRNGDHRKCPVKQRDQVPKPGGKGNKGDGKGKGNGKGKDKVWIKVYCKKFLETGSCDDANCTGPFLDADEVKKWTNAYPGKIKASGYMQVGGGDSGKGKGQGKGK